MTLSETQSALLAAIKTEAAGYKPVQSASGRMMPATLVFSTKALSGLLDDALAEAGKPVLMLTSDQILADFAALVAAKVGVRQRSLMPAANGEIKIAFSVSEVGAAKARKLKADQLAKGCKRRTTFATDAEWAAMLKLRDDMRKNGAQLPL